MVTQRAFFSAIPLIQRALIALIVAVAVVLPTTMPANAAIPNLRKYAGIVVDAKSGKVLYEEQADSKRYPASVTKVMTLYILFQELAAGNINLNTKMKVSRFAASAVPTKLGLAAGSEITVENAIKALVTLSANDMARVIAEHISGTEAKFAERMTATARALGMNSTRYANASGLPDADQTTTARDQARLGIAVYQHFPTYYEYFQTRSFTYGKRTYGNHNRLLGENGIDGIKTGYINASGSNLLTAARRNNSHIVVVGFGFNSSASRDAKVRELVRTYQPKARSGGYLDVAMIPTPGRKGSIMVATAQPVAPLPRPAFFNTMPTDAGVQMAAAQAPAALAPAAPLPAPTQRIDLATQPAVQAATVLGGAPQAPMPNERPLDVIGAWIEDTFQLGPSPSAPTPLPSAPVLAPPGGQTMDLMTSGSVAVAAIEPQPFGIIPGPQPIVAPLEQQQVAQLAPAPIEGWVVQIGAAPSEQGATQLLGDAAGRIGTLSNFRSYIERFEKNGQVFYRARFAGFPGRDEATSMCDAIKRENMSCLAMQS